MNRQHPFISIAGFIFTFVLLVGLGLAFLYSGELTFSPGQVSAQSLAGLTLNGFISHADFEKQCNLCHEPLRKIRATLCTACHQDITDQISNQKGVHGKLQTVDKCANCHAEHNGRNYDLTRSALVKFDHALTSFSLNWHQVNFDTTLIDCSACHGKIGLNFDNIEESCIKCHTDKDTGFMDKHIQDDGKTCLACHDGKDRMRSFNHNLLAFPLTGKHTSVRCTECHKDSKPSSGGFNALSHECINCHSEPLIHQGSFTPNCAMCHTTDSWATASLNGVPFNHQTQTGFSLAHHTQDYKGMSVTCKTCHPENLNNFNVNTCVSCHEQHDTAFSIKHLDQYGPACLDCHDGIDRMKHFDHANVFPIDGMHALIACVSCHVDRRFAGTSSQCSQCHTEPAIHTGFFGLDCQDCHTTTAWRPALLKIHTFPLSHGEKGEVKCQTCHPNSYIEYTCYNCHEHQPTSLTDTHSKKGISSSDLTNCFKCHPKGTIN